MFFQPFRTVNSVYEEEFIERIYLKKSLLERLLNRNPDRSDALPATKVTEAKTGH